MKNYTYKTKSNYDRVIEALKKFELTLQKKVVKSKDIKKWLDLYSELHSLCLKNRYFNSCYPGFPCLHTDNNIEYEFSMFYYEIKNIFSWTEANKTCSAYLKALIQSKPESEEKNDIMREFIDSYDYPLPTFDTFNFQPDLNYYKAPLSFFNYNVLKWNVSIPHSSIPYLNSFNRHSLPAPHTIPKTPYFRLAYSLAITR